MPSRRSCSIPTRCRKDGTVALAGVVGERRRQRRWPTPWPMPAATGSPGTCATWPPGQDTDDVMRLEQVLRGSVGPRTAAGFFYGRYPEPKEGEDLRASELLPEAVLPQARHAAGGRQAGLRNARPQGVALFGNTVSDDGKYLMIDVLAGHRRRQHGALQASSTSPTRRSSQLIDNFDAGYSSSTTTGRCSISYDEPRRPARPRDRDRHDASRSRRTGARLFRRPTKRCTAPIWWATASWPTTCKTPTRKSRCSTSTASSLAEVNSAGHGHGVSGFRRQAAGPRDVLQLRFVHHARRRSIATTSPAGKSTVFRAPKVDFDPADYTTEQVFYTSKDGTRVPMFISYKKGLSRRTGRRRRICTATAGSTFRSRRAFSVVEPGVDGDGAASSPCPTCAAAASTAKSGTRPAPSCKSRTCSTTSSPRPSG